MTNVVDGAAGVPGGYWLSVWNLDSLIVSDTLSLLILKINVRGQCCQIRGASGKCRWRRRRRITETTDSCHLSPFQLLFPRNLAFNITRVRRGIWLYCHNPVFLIRFIWLCLCFWAADYILIKNKVDATSSHDVKSHVVMWLTASCPEAFQVITTHLSRNFIHPRRKLKKSQTKSICTHP